ncbi:MAG: hypothetical protein P0Y48_01380 [Candidatus Microbacterium phytovorans]|uniref:Uncharacterized protein n=1 Tax=Candidatus Microbacterium phytovorans TaxID=3121374 RepID=A0AAJ5W3G7_9MICO|nr:hypothetical protein [Microbacterium sp.]WEK13892.1 MAG: hypothetical protein P0Y48_01380 [Microbacterium sp.]
MAGKAKGKPQFAAKELPVEEPTSSDKLRPVFCLEHIRTPHDVKNPDLTKDQRSAFAERLQELASVPWSQLKMSGRHAQGFELLPVEKLKFKMPSAFEDTTKVHVFRYSGKLPMVGVRSNATFHILAIERQFGEVYDHA